MRSILVLVVAAATFAVPAAGAAAEEEAPWYCLIRGSVKERAGEPREVTLYRVDLNSRELVALARLWDLWLVAAAFDAAREVILVTGKDEVTLTTKYYLVPAAGGEAEFVAERVTPGAQASLARVVYDRAADAFYVTRPVSFSEQEYRTYVERYRPGGAVEVVGEVEGKAWVVDAPGDGRLYLCFTREEEKGVYTYRLAYFDPATGEVSPVDFEPGENASFWAARAYPPEAGCEAPLFYEEEVYEGRDTKYVYYVGDPAHPGAYERRELSAFNVQYSPSRRALVFVGYGGGMWGRYYLDVVKLDDPSSGDDLYDLPTPPVDEAMRLPLTWVYGLLWVE